MVGGERENIEGKCHQKVENAQKGYFSHPSPGNFLRTCGKTESLQL